MRPCAPCCTTLILKSSKANSAKVHTGFMRSHQKTILFSSLALGLLALTVDRWIMTTRQGSQETHHRYPWPDITDCWFCPRAATTRRSVLVG